MADVFISHAVADEPLATLFTSFLKEAVGVPAAAIFCSSVKGHGIPLAVNFNDYMKTEIQQPKLVVLLMTESYMESAFCLMELGAAWAKSHTTLPVVVPPVPFLTVTKTLGLTQAWSIDNHSGLVDLRTLVTAAGVKLEARTEHDWDGKRDEWRVALKQVLKDLPRATKIDVDAHREVLKSLENSREETESLERLLEGARAKCAALEAAKDPAEVRAINREFSGADALQAEFDQLIAAVEKARPVRASRAVFRHILMDHFDKAGSIDWADRSVREEFEPAVQYKLLTRDGDAVAWNGSKLTPLRIALKRLEEFLGSFEGQELVQAMADGVPMEPDDLEFWEHHLG